MAADFNGVDPSGWDQNRIPETPRTPEGNKLPDPAIDYSDNNPHIIRNFGISR